MDQITSMFGGGGSGGGSKEFGRSSAETTFGNNNYGGGSETVIWVALAVIGLAAVVAFGTILRLAK